MRNILIATVLLVMFLSCEDKNNDEKSFPVNLSTHFASNENFRVFTAEGEINDKSIISSILLNYTEELPALDEIAQNKSIDITFISDEKVLYRQGDNSVDTLRLTIQNSIYYFEYSDTTYYIPGAYEETINLTDTSRFRYMPMFYKEMDVPLSTGYSKVIFQKTCFYAEGDINKLSFPFVDCYIIKDVGYFSQIIEFDVIASLNNRLKRDVSFQLSSSDTLIFREYDLILSSHE